MRYVVAGQTHAGQRPFVANGATHFPEQAQRLVLELVKLAKRPVGTVPLLHELVRLDVFVARFI